MVGLTKNIDIIYQYSLLIAGDMGDSYAYRLGPIHLLKYLYLADCSYASRNSGKSFSGIEWRFYNFGPWSSEAHSRIQNSMSAIGAITHQFISDYSDDDYFRFEKRDSGLLQQCERELPPIITRNLKLYVKKFRNNTAELLDYVYTTEPMLSAEPDEVLDLTTLITESKFLSKSENEEFSCEFHYSNKKKKKIEAGIKELKLRLSNHVNQKVKIDPSPNAEYDEIFYDGLNMLETADIPRLSDDNLTVEFDKSVWKSSTRKGNYGE